MRISKVVFALVAAPILAFTLSAKAEFLGEDSIFSGVRIPTKGEAGLPKDLKNYDAAFSVVLDDTNPSAEIPADVLASMNESTADRDPASVKPGAMSVKPSKQKLHWSASASDGFEFKIRVKQLISAVWVLKRGDRYDLVFANNTGSRVNLSLPAEQFYALKNAATDLRAANDSRQPASSDLSKCKDQFIQMEVMETKTRKQVATCLNAKSKPAEELRRFGSALTAMVR